MRGMRKLGLRLNQATQARRPKARRLDVVVRAVVAPLFIVMAVQAVAAGGPPAQQRYRYVNDQGVVVLDQSIPTRFLDRGYTILGGDGHVIKVVPSVEDRKRLDEQQRVVDAERKRQDRLAQSDQELLRMYSSPEDVERARDRKMESIRTAIAITEGNLRRLIAQKKTIEVQGVQLERSGRAASPEMVNNLKIVSGQIRDRQIEIAGRKDELEHVRKAFDVNAQRVRELYSYSAAGSASGAAATTASPGTAAADSAPRASH